MLVSGANAFLYEVLWTRMLAHVIGGSIYAFATMLAAFLTGIALGGGLAGRFAANKERAAIAFAFTQVAIGVLSIGVYAWMGPLIPDSPTTWALALFAGSVMLPATIFIGATLPLSVRVLARDETEATTGTARIYAWNTVGAIIGAILAGFVLIPGLGFEGTIRFAVSVNFFLALWAAACVARPRPIPVGIACAGVVAVLAAYSPPRPQAVVLSGAYFRASAVEEQELYYAVGRSSTVMLLAVGNNYDLRTNGLPEASVAVRGSPPNVNTQQWLTALTVAARPDTRDMLVVGFGGGVALEGVPPTVESIDVIELEEEVITANRLLSEKRNFDPLADPRFNVVINDARNALRLTRKSYDAIVSQPSHPWTAGASHLFTREFVADVRSHLNEGGVFLQWMNSQLVDEALLRTLAATLLGVFEHVRLYQPNIGVLMFLASDAPLDVELEAAYTGRPFIDSPAHFSRLALSTAEDLLASLVMDGEGLRSFARFADISTDDNNLMATRSRAWGDGLQDADVVDLFEPFDPLAQRESWVHTRLGEHIDYGYLARRLAGGAQVSRATQLAGTINDFSEQFEVYGLLFRANGEEEQSREALTNALRANPLNMQARYALVRDHIDALSRGDAPEDIREIAAEFTGPAAAVLRGLPYEAAADWPSLAAMDDELAETRLTDAWFQEAVRLRAAWRVNAAEDRERLALEALQLIEQALVLASDEDLYRMRTESSRTLGDHNRLLESSAVLGGYVSDYLNSSYAEEYTLSPDELDQVREKLANIAEPLRGDLDIADPDRLSSVLENMEELIEYVDNYSEQAESGPSGSD